MMGRPLDVSVLLVGWGWSFDQIRTSFMEMDRLGYDAAYLGDDLFSHPPREEVIYDEVYEPWTTLPALASMTERIKLGSLVSPVNRRNPGLFAKMTTMVDIASGGRLIVGRGLGNAPEQHRSIGQEFPEPPVRFEMLEEELAIMRGMWTQPRTTFEGKHFSVHEAVNEPKPVSDPHPEILLGYGGGKKMARLAAEYASRVNLFGLENEKIRTAVERLDEACAGAGRDPASIKVSRLINLVFTEKAVPEADREPVLREVAAEIGDDPAEFLADNVDHIPYFIGPPQDCPDFLSERVLALGLREVVLCIDSIGRNTYERTMAGLRTFATDVMPRLS
jgi:alkanesulfonate monooxygenase SsuD/methylene tetrahydromethanopterin reductase-like flavin-dependent oxidoreductase (luciferase family)